MCRHIYAYISVGSVCVCVHRATQICVHTCISCVCISMYICTYIYIRICKTYRDAWASKLYVYNNLCVFVHSHTSAYEMCTFIGEILP
jgi:hypothetical protein